MPEKKKSKSSKKTGRKPRATKQQKSAPRQEKIDSDAFLKQFQSYLDNNQPDKAQKYIDSAFSLVKWQRLNLQSFIEHKRGNFEAAKNCLMQAIREPKKNPVVYKNLASHLSVHGFLREALPYAEKAYKELPKDLKVIQIYLNCLLDVSKTEGVLEVLEKALPLYPTDRALRVSKASALRSVGRKKESLELIETLIEEFPEEGVLYRIKADTLGDTEPVDALPFYEKALEVSEKSRGKPDPAVQWNMSLHLLRVRDIERGFKFWEQGFHPLVGTMGRNLPERVKRLKRADKEKIDKNKWTIVVSEQGIGDQVLFLSVMREAIKEFGKILMIAENRMHPILKRSFPEISIGGPGMTYTWENSPLDKNGYIPLGSLPGRYRKSVECFSKGRMPFLRADKKKYEKYRKMFSDKAAGRPIIGISWKGGYWAIQKKTKALDLEYWAPIFKKDALFVNLQYGNIEKDLKYIAENKIDITFLKGVDFVNDLDDWLAIAGACDGIISVSTALVHFAGAVGQKVAVVMPSKYGPWHLGVNDKQSIAYKNVRIYRPEKGEPLENTINNVADLIIR